MDHRTRHSNSPRARATVTSIIVGSAVTIGCSKADLVVRDITVNEHTPTTISYTFTVENVDYGDTGFDLPGSIDGRLGFRAHCSTDGIEQDGPDAGRDEIRPVNPTLLPGETVEWTHEVSTTVDVLRWPYLVIEIDPEDAIIEHDEKNNKSSTVIAR